MTKALIKRAFRSLGWEISRTAHTDALLRDIPTESRRLYQECAPYALSNLERIDALVTSIDYLCKRGIPGDIVECGVWRGGSVYAAAKALAARGCLDRKFFLFDLFDASAMLGTYNQKTEHDRRFDGATVEDMINSGTFANAKYEYSLEEVRALLRRTGYPEENFVFKIGRIENTLPCDDIERVAILHLDTDWYESTKHELEHLYPKLVPGGVLLVDDYGFWQGCRKAVDEYIEENQLKLLLHRTDHSARSAVKAIYSQ